MSVIEEALFEARSLKRAAEESATIALIENMTPFIKEMISKEIAGKTSMLFEEEDFSSSPSLDSMNSVGPTSTNPGSLAPTEMPMDSMSSLGNAPIKVTGGPDTLDMPMPDAEGKITIDFDKLFIPVMPGEETGIKSDQGPASLASQGTLASEPVDVNPSPASLTNAPGELSPLPTNPTTNLTSPSSVIPPSSMDATSAAPIPEPGTEELNSEEPKMENYDLFSENLDKTANQIHRAYSSTSGIPSVMKEMLKEKLFTLIEGLENLAQKGLVSEKLSQIVENRLEILNQKLKETISSNTYYKTKDIDVASKSLKELAAKMLAESDTVKGGDNTSPADSFKNEKSMTVDNPTEKTADKAGAHAMKVTEPTVTLKTEATELAKLEEELKSLIAESEGDALTAIDGKKDLAGVGGHAFDKKVGPVDTTKNPAAGPSNPASYVQGVAENMEHSKDTGSEEEVDNLTLGHPVKKEQLSVSKKALAEETKKLKAENIRKQMRALQEQLKECGMEMEEEAPGALSGGTPGNSMPMEHEVPGVDVDKHGANVNITIDLGSLVPELDGMDDDDEIEITDDDEEVPSVDSSEPSDMDHSSEEDLDSSSDEGLEDKKEKHLFESNRKRNVPTITQKVISENKALKAQLLEQQLFNSKVVHLQPFLNNKNLTKEQKQKIVEYLDRGKSINDVKYIYSRIKTLLEESTQKARAKAGSSSKVSASGSAKNLNESTVVAEGNLYEGATLVETERNRLMELAGIKRK